MTGLACPDRHRDTDPAALIAAADGIGDDHRILVTLAEGFCPACPAMPLGRDTLIIGDAEVTAARCSCCGAMWRWGPQTWECLHTGRLAERRTARSWRTPRARHAKRARQRGERS